ncbi:MAG: hypothetical protein ACI8PZ_000356 [Myxococcota bacterium]
MRAFLRHVAPHLGLALENLARVSTQDRDDRYVVAPDRLLSLSQSFGLPGTVHSTALRVVTAAVDAILAARGVLYLFDPDLDELRLVAAAHLLDKALEHRVNRGADDAQRISPGLGPAGDVLMSGMPRAVADGEVLGVSSGWWPDSSASGVFLFLPLRAEGEVVGVIGLNRDRMTPAFQDGERALAPLLDHGATALLRTRLYQPLVIDNETGLFDGRFVEALLGDAIRRADASESRVSVLSLRLGVSSIHRGGVSQPPPILEIAERLQHSAQQDLDLVGHLGHGRFVAILEETGADVAHTLVSAFLEDIAAFRTDVSIHAAAVVERRLSESAGSVWARAHSLLMRIYDEGPGLRLGVASQVRERVLREHVPDWVTPVDPQRR